MGNDEVGRTSYRITELQNYRITELQSYRVTELLNDIRRTRRSAERVLIMPNLEDDKHYSHSSAEAVALLRLIQMSEADIKAGRVLSVEQAREAINRSRRERIERAKNQSGESGH
jgi:predicted metallo-beta-lactamase superfamily hydrolase